MLRGPSLSMAHDMVDEGVGPTFGWNAWRRFIWLVRGRGILGF
jgi:hypothetical protein